MSKAFDGRVALDEAEFAARWGEVHALLGENGAGKSTLMTIACGLYAPDHGELIIDGSNRQLRGPSDAAAAGVGMVHQHFKLVPAFTALENVRLTCWRRFRGQSAGTIRKALEDASEKADLPIDPTARIMDLSIAERQRVEILRTLMLGVRILILDEPTAVLTDQEADRLLRTARNLAASGTCVILISHKLHEVKTHADRVTVMRAGKTVARDLDAGSLDIPDLARLMVGETLPTPQRQSRPPGSVAFSIDALHVARDDGAPAVNGLSLNVRAGEIYGLAGVGGNGQTELAEAVCGLMPISGGDIALAGTPVGGQPPAKLRRAGLRNIPADRYRRAIAADLDVAENFAMPGLRAGNHGPLLWASRRSMNRATERAVSAFDVRGAAPSTPARLLSGGNAQKLVLARELDSQCVLIVAHSPTRGLDVRAYAAVHDRLRRARDDGTAVLLISEDLDEILALADRIGVMSRGRLTGEFESPFERAAIGHAMVGHA